MQFTANGPDIPLEVLQAQEEGRFVLFCGAGVSMPAGLPGFRGLLEKVYEGLRAEPKPIEQVELAARNFDRVFGLLERRFGSAAVRHHVQAALAVPARPPLGTHGALLELAKDRSGHTRLVTTNFDRLFEAADPNVRLTAAPLLPVPKPKKWDCLVHLHGRISDADPHGLHLVISSADFGVAYLVERWASRFVSELFNHCTVLFVGYSVSDPVMRYLIDAIAAERLSDDRLRTPFVLTHADADELASRAEWEAKGISPVFYELDDSHSKLHETLRVWAGIWSGGLDSRVNIVTEIGVKDPATLTQELLDQFLWALSEPLGAPARAFAALGKRAGVQWLEVFERQGLLAGPAGNEERPIVALAGYRIGAQPVFALDPVRHAIVTWMLEHLDEPQLITWVVRSGGHLHPQLSDRVRQRLDETEALQPGLRKVWRALTGSVPLAESEPLLETVGLVRQLAGPWSVVLRTDLLKAFSPRIRMRPTRFMDLSFLGGEAVTPGSTVRSVVSFECVLRTERLTRELVSRVRERSDWPSIAADLAPDLTSLLRHALELLELLESASVDYDHSYISYASLESREQSHGHERWTTLIEMVVDTFDQLLLTDVERARHLTGLWLAIPFPTFRRLVLYAVRHLETIQSLAVGEAIANHPEWWLWTSETQVELVATLPRLFDLLSEVDRDQIAALLLAGPPRDMFREDLDGADWSSLRDHMVWQRLVALREGGTELSGPVMARLAELDEAHPDWGRSTTARASAPVRIEVGWGIPSDFTSEALLEMDASALVDTLRGHKSNREGLLESTWPEAAERDVVRTLEVLKRALEVDFLAPEVWAPGIEALRKAGQEESLKLEVLEFLAGLPVGLLDAPGIVRAVVELLRVFSEEPTQSLRVELLKLWDVTFPRTLTAGGVDSTDLMTQSVNHPTGRLTEVLLLLMRSDNPKRAAGIADDIRSRLERVLVAPEGPARLGRVVLASRLYFLHDVDPEWAQRNLLPHFEWTNAEEATAAWQGYLWSPWMGPSLWAAVKPLFLETFHHVEVLGKLIRQLSSLLASVGVEGDGLLTVREASRCLHSVGPEGRAAVAFWIQDRLRGAEEKAGKLWRDRVHPWLDAVWPREPALQAPESSEWLAHAAINAREEFANAAQFIGGLIGPVPHPFAIVHELMERGLSESSPDASLELVNAIMSDVPEPGMTRLSDFLDRIATAAPRLLQVPQFRRLREIADNLGL